MGLLKKKNGPAAGVRRGSTLTLVSHHCHHHHQHYNQSMMISSEWDVSILQCTVKTLHSHLGCPDRTWLEVDSINIIGKSQRGATQVY